MKQRMTVAEYNTVQDEQMTEYEHQCRLFQELKPLESTHPELTLIYHIPNGEYRAKATGVKLKSMGVKPGVPDIHLPVAKGGYHSLYIELKSLKKSAKLEASQERWLDALRGEGNRAVVCGGWRVALDEIVRYLEA